MIAELLLLMLGTIAPDTGAVTIEYVAHAAFRIHSSGGASIVVDPYGSRIWLGYDFPAGIETDAVLITHPHYDHDGGVSRGGNFPWDATMRVLRDPGHYTVGDIAVHGMRGKHADPYGMEFGQKNTIWLLEVDGLRIVHVGDNGPLTEANVAALGHVDVLMLPIDADYHILKEHEIQAILNALKPRWLIPMHYCLPDVEPAGGCPSDLGPIDPWIEGKNTAVRAGTHRVSFSSDRVGGDPEIIVFAHSPSVQRP